MNAPGSWAVAPSMGLETGELPRDAIYGGLRLGDTGVGAYTLPSRPMTGVFEGQNNPGTVARPLVAFDVNRRQVGFACRPEHPQRRRNATVGRLARRTPGLGTRLGRQTRSARPTAISAAGSAGDGRGADRRPRRWRRLRHADVDRHRRRHPHEQFRRAARLEAGRAQASDRSHEGSAAGRRDRARAVDEDRLRLRGFDAEWKAGRRLGCSDAKDFLDAVGGTPELQAAFDQNKYIPGVADAQAQRDAATGLDWGIRDRICKTCDCRWRRGRAGSIASRPGWRSSKRRAPCRRSQARRRQGGGVHANRRLSGDAGSSSNRRTSRIAARSRTTVRRLVAAATRPAVR